MQHFARIAHSSHLYRYPYTQQRPWPETRALIFPKRVTE